MTEIRCREDMDLFGAETEDELEELDQDLYHRLIEPPGSNIDDPDRGYGLLGKLSSAVRAGTTDAATALQRGIEAELRKDDRVLDVRATVAVPAPGEYRIAIQIVANAGELGIVLEADGAGGVRKVA